MLKSYSSKIQLENILGHAVDEETFETDCNNEEILGADWWSTPAEEAEPELDMRIIPPCYSDFDVHIIADNEETFGTDWRSKLAGKSWPTLVGLSTEEAERKIKEENPKLHLHIIPANSMVTLDYCSNRVRIFADKYGKVASVPSIG
ncbi:wound-induced proteinase inhibitor 1-like isoform X2 [Nicotiana tabacum]|uniref:Wound-induced proteinase inhibitor 1-like isoform X2 n=2 Tax=Nicotiana TaxID=4085 RepID=A0A1S4CUI8_TOBAC|nr:PREDICTED: wound-induced proteinase inhibitor 1-like isoform X2 [Nicotiana sylvestris]XP_016504897.1 PREDICTED: wound-induced proteinase inhibitor 1-like isoform X2 [Nicotiana tabacum]